MAQRQGTATMSSIAAQLQTAETMFAAPGFGASPHAERTMEGMTKNLEEPLTTLTQLYLLCSSFIYHYRM